ncbi:MAG: penicillin-binding protein 1C [Comamonadaceae bacterium]|nr:MAG: penicillin-binding protein 1C [Comamonadaceae bacterium]
MKHRLASVLRALSLLPALWLPAASFAVAGFDQVRQAHRPSDTLVVDRDGEPLQRIRTDANVRRGRWVALEDVSPALRHAMLLSEDRRFYQHGGIDWRATSAAAWANLWNTRTRGASTITMQLAGLLDDDLRRGSGGRSVAQKLGQGLAAQSLERGWRKDQILEAYLNLVPFRGELVGIDALSRTLFGKAANGLDAREASIAAVLVRAPNASPALIARRACDLLREMEPEARSACAALDLYAAGAVQRRAFEPASGIAPHLARQALRALREAGPPREDALPDTVRTTLSAPLQRFALATLQRHLRELAGRHVEDGAVLVLDNASGDVLAWVGSSGTLSRAGEVDAVLAPRQPGSTLKPLLYAQAIAERRLTAASLLDDSPAQIATAGGLYIPQNYDRRFKGQVSVRTALASSLNVPAVRTLVMVSPDAFARQLGALGVPLREGGGYYGYSLALGSAELSLLALTNAYRTLANAGRFSPTRLLPPAARPVDAGTGAPAAPTAKRPQPTVAATVIDPRAAFVIGDILADANARARTFGLDSVLATRFWTAVKTGTSKDMRDNWALGWSERYTVGVWVGNAGGAPMWEVSGTSGAAPVWAELMRFLHRTTPSHAPVPPPGLVRIPVRFGPAARDDAGGAAGQPIEAAHGEWFLSGTEQSLFALDAGPAAAPEGAASSSGARILAPSDGTIVALDPDIPPRHQRLRFEAAGGDGLQWRIDGRPQGRGPRAQWLPWPGRHVIALHDARGRELDRVRIEVRGAGVAPDAPRR